MTTHKNGIGLRNLAILTLFIVGIGWFGIWLNARAGSPTPDQSPGMTIWLITPLVLTLLLRAFAKDGWKDLGLKPAFKTHGKHYALSILVYPVSIGLTLLLGAAFGAVSLTGFTSQGLGTFLKLLGIAFVFNFFKNIFEEFVWRGYLTPKLKRLGVHDLANHAIVGVIWTAWHLPYWIGLLDAATIQRFTGLSLPVFILLSALALITSSVLYGELRLATGSVWPAVLLHTVGNALTLTLLMEGFIQCKRNEAIFTPGMGGLLGILIIALIGWRFYRLRTGKAL